MLGFALVWRKAGKVLAGPDDHDHSHAHRHVDQSHTCDDTCSHAHMPTPEVIKWMRGWRDMAGVVLAAGLRPCAGAIVVLVFALSQGLFAAGIAAVLAMALGTGLTTGSIAALAVFAKSIATRLTRGRGLHGVKIIAGIELFAAAFVLVLGASLLTGVWANAAS
jgi:nickel/cobalt transporter (NicO) family protein